MTRLWSALAVFLLVTADVLAGGPLTRLDHAVADRARSIGTARADWRHPGQRWIDVPINLGDPRLVALVVGLAVVWISWRSRTVVPLVRLAVLGGVTVSLVLAMKYGIGRPAPTWSTHIPDRSYPSGHTATAVVLWSLLAALAAEHPGAGIPPRLVRWVARVAPVTVMVGMVLRDYHWVSDVLGAAALGVVLLQAERLALGHWVRARGPGRDGAAGPAAVRAGPGLR